MNTDDEVVYVTSSRSHVYHATDPRWPDELHRSRNRILQATTTTRGEARAQGLDTCDKCYGRYARERTPLWEPRSRNKRRSTRSTAA